jgi:hypothetical protein
MLKTPKILRAVLLGAAMAAPVVQAAQPQGNSLQAESALVNKYAAFSGSQQNAISLVNGLRNGTQITIQPAVPGCAPVPPPPGNLPPSLPPGSQPPGLPPSLVPSPPPPPAVLPATFTPPTGNLGYGNVDIAINLAQQQLAKAGLPQPTPDQVRASFMGGVVRTCAGASSTLQGILVLRAAKQGWGSIASQLGLDFSESD